MKKFESSPNQSPAQRGPENPQANDPDRGETAHRQKRPRAPQFGSDRRNPRDTDAHRPKSARHRGDANGLPRNAADGNQPSERRKATQDRRQSWS